MNPQELSLDREVKLCPMCGSGKVEEVSILGGAVDCMTCGWKGSDKDLLVRVIHANEVEDTAHAVLVAYINLLQANASVPVGQAMIDSGLVGRLDKVRLGRLLKAALLSAFKGTMQEIEKMQQEISNGRAS